MGFMDITILYSSHGEPGEEGNRRGSQHKQGFKWCLLTNLWHVLEGLEVDRGSRIDLSDYACKWLRYAGGITENEIKISKRKKSRLWKLQEWPFSLTPLTQTQEPWPEAPGGLTFSTFSYLPTLPDGLSESSTRMIDYLSPWSECLCPPTPNIYMLET